MYSVTFFEIIKNGFSVGSFLITRFINLFLTKQNVAYITLGWCSFLNVKYSIIYSRAPVIIHYI